MFLLSFQDSRKIWNPTVCFLSSPVRQNPPCTHAFRDLSLAVFWHCVTWPYQEGAGGLGSCLPRILQGLNSTFESSFFQFYRQRQGEHSHRTQPSSVKQFQLLLLMNLGVGGRESIGFYFRCGYMQGAHSTLIFNLFKGGIWDINSCLGVFLFQ